MRIGWDESTEGSKFEEIEIVGGRLDSMAEEG